MILLEWLYTDNTNDDNGDDNDTNNDNDDDNDTKNDNDDT